MRISNAKQNTFPSQYLGSWRPSKRPHDAYALLEPPDTDDEEDAEFSCDDDDELERMPS
jgi:hypothetical protein